jgi:hypothetical protein
VAGGNRTPRRSQNRDVTVSRHPAPIIQPAAARVSASGRRRPGCRCFAASTLPGRPRDGVAVVCISACPAHQVFADAVKSPEQLGRVEASVVDSAAHDGIDLRCEVGARQPAAKMEWPAPDRATDLLRGVVRYGRAEARDQHAASVPGRPRVETCSQGIGRWLSVLGWRTPR